MVGSWVIAAVVFVGAGVCLWLGLRGKRVNEHPVCRRCRFDLGGVYPGIATCPECGAELGATRAVRVGVRRRRGWLVGFGASGMVLAAAGIVLMVVLSVMGMPNSQKPVRWLLLEANGTQDSAAHAALDELNARLRAGVLSDADRTRIVARALAVQADPNATWRTGWGDFVEGVYQSGRLPEADWEAYAAGAFTVELAARERVRVGDPVPFEWVLRQRTSHRTLLAVAYYSHGTWLGDQMIWHLGNEGVVVRQMIGGYGLPGSQAAPNSERIVMSEPNISGLWLPERLARQPGQQTVYSRLVLSVLALSDPTSPARFGGLRSTSRGGETAFSRDDDPDWLNQPVDDPRHPRSTTRSYPRSTTQSSATDGFTPILHKRLELQAEIEVVPDTADSVELVREPGITNEIMRELSEKLRLSYNTANMGMPGIDLNWASSLELPTDAAFDMVWRLADGREYVVGDLVVHGRRHPADVRTWPRFLHRLVPEDELLLLDRVDLIFRPNVELARNTVRLLRITGEEIVLPGVEIRRPSHLSQMALSHGQPQQAPKVTHDLLLELVKPMQWSTGRMPQAFVALALRPPFVYVMTDVGTLHTHRIHDQAEFRLRPPNQRGAVVSAGDSVGLVVFGDHLITSMQGGIRIFDLSDPAEPRMVATRMPDREHRTRALLVRDDEALVVTERGLLRHDLTNPAESKVGVEAARVLAADAPGIVFNAAMHGGRLVTIERPREFDGDEHATIGVYDLDDPAGIRRIGQYVHDQRLDHVLSLNDDLVLAVGGAGLVLLDVSGAQAGGAGDPVVVGRQAGIYSTATTTNAHGRVFVALDGELFVLDGHGLTPLEQILPTRRGWQMSLPMRWTGLPRGDGQGDLLAGVGDARAFVIRVHDPATAGAAPAAAGAQAGGASSADEENEEHEEEEPR